MADVRINIDPLRRFSAGLNNQIAGAPGPVSEMFERIGIRLLAFFGKRYDRLSRGGGEWAPLAPSTIAGRRKGPRVQGARRSRAAVEALRRRGVRTAGRAAILKDRGQLRQAMNVGAAGNTLRRVRGGIVVGIGGEQIHDVESGLSFRRLAQIHHNGEGNVPKRTLVTNRLDLPTRRGIQQDVRRAMTALGRRSR